MRTAEQLSVMEQKFLAAVWRSVPGSHHSLFTDMQFQQTEDDRLHLVFSKRNLQLVKGFYGKDVEAAMRQCAPGMAYRLDSSAPAQTQDAVFRQGFRPECTFDTFVATGRNVFADHAAKQVAGQLAASDFSGNPLILHGPCSVGKTHLLHAIGHNVLAKCPGSKVLYEPANSFLEAMTRAIRTKNGEEMDAFRRRYLELDLLLLDDLHFVQGKKRTQEEILRIHNELVEGSRGMMVVASGESPGELSHLSPQLASRLRRGQVISLMHPAPDAVYRILQMKVSARPDRFCEEDWPGPCYQYLADTVCDMRELEGCVHQIVRHAEAIDADGITVPLVKAAVGQRLLNPRTATAEQVLEVVAKHYNVDCQRMLSSSRQRKITLARQVAMYLCRTTLNYSFPEIGRLFDGKDHSTAMHANKKIERLMETDLEMEQSMTAITRAIDSLSNS